jgi:hypothetical protein
VADTEPAATVGERLAYDVAADLRRQTDLSDATNELLYEAADKLEGLIELLANAETDRDQARAAASLIQEDAARTGNDVIAEIAIRYLEAEPGEEATDVYGELVRAVMVVKHRTDPDWTPNG